MDKNQFDNDRSIDPSQLDLEAVRQPDLFFKYAEMAVAARGEADRQKFQVEVLEAKLEIQVRESPEEFGLKKVTEGAIKAAVKIHDSYVEAYENYLGARRVSSLLEKAVEAMEQKKRMLEVLITLHGQQYFAGPSVPRDLVGAWKEQQSQNEEQINTKQKRSARRRVRKGTQND